MKTRTLERGYRLSASPVKEKAALARLLIEELGVYIVTV